MMSDQCFSDLTMISSKLILRKSSVNAGAGILLRTTEAGDVGDDFCLTGLKRDLVRRTAVRQS